MTTRFLIALELVVCCAIGCSGSEPDAGAPRGSTGSGVWVDSSTGIELKIAWSYEHWGPNAGPAQFGASCLVLDRAAMRDDQLAALGELVLIPLEDKCTADGYTYTQLTVRDSDGGKAVYRDTGCSFLRVEGAMAMLPPDSFFASAFPMDPAAACPE